MAGSAPRRLAVEIAGPEDLWGVAVKAERKWGGVEGRFWGSLEGLEDFSEWEEEVRKIAGRAGPEIVMREGGVGVWTQEQVRAGERTACGANGARSSATKRCEYCAFPFPLSHARFARRGSCGARV